MDSPFLSIVIPAYNEEARLPLTLPKLLAYLQGQSYSWEIVVADDGSADGTARFVERTAHETGAPLSLLSLPHGGKGHAVRSGMLAARGTYRFMCDADLAMPIEELPRFLPPALADYDVAIGVREGPGAQRFNEPWHEHLQGRVFNALVQLVLVPGLKDTQCGFKCFTAEAADYLFRKQRLTGAAFDAELLFLARRAGLRIREVPITWVHDRQTRVHKSLRNALRMASEVLAVRWYAITGRYG